VSYMEFVMLVVAFFIAVPVVSVYVVYQSIQKQKWLRGEGERVAKAEYARLRRERPELRDAQLSEAEFVHKFVQAGRGRYFAT
jgi:hypothetical protein